MKKESSFRELRRVGLDACGTSQNTLGLFLKKWAIEEQILKNGKMGNICANSLIFKIFTCSTKLLLKASIKPHDTD